MAVKRNDFITYDRDQTANAFGGAGDDYIDARGAGGEGPSFSVIYGEEGNDTIFFASQKFGQLIVYGGDGNDPISGSDGFLRRPLWWRGCRHDLRSR